MAEMKACRILIPLRGLRFSGGADFRDNCRDNQRCHRQERYRCFVYVIIHTNSHSIQDAKGFLSCIPSQKAPNNMGFAYKRVRDLDTVMSLLSDLWTLLG
jgi:hypothetical protein